MRIPLAALALLACFSGAGARDPAAVLRGLARDRQQALQELRRSRERIERERRRLHRRIAELTAGVRRLEGEVKALRGRLADLEEQRRRLLAQQAAVGQELKEISGCVRAVARDLNALFGRLPSSAEVPERFETLRPLLEEQRFPGLEDIRRLVQLCFQEMELSKAVVKRTGSFISPQGQRVKGEVLRAGEIVAYWRRGGRVGALTYSRSRGGLLALTARLPRGVRHNVSAYMDGRADSLYLDLSGGAALRLYARRPGLLEHLRSGGPIVLPILFIGALGLGLAAERVWFLWGRAGRLEGGLLRELEEAAERGSWERVQEILRSARGHPLANVLGAGMRHRGRTREELEGVLEEALLAEEMRLGRFLPALRVLAAVAPLLGLLGTVTGIIHVFQAITLYGAGDPRMMSGGIAEALVTTEVGLAVAIPIMLLHSLLSARASALSAEAEEQARLLLPLLEGRGG